MYADYGSAAEEQDRLVDKVIEVEKDIITSDMSDLEKARAINQYLVDNVEYDFDALKAQESYQETLSKGSSLDDEPADAFTDPYGTYGYAWSPSGALLKGKGVCVSYASAFQVLSTQAGLECVCVMGETVNGRHAWNYVKIDGAWRVVDPTWNDNPGQEERYFNLSLDDETYLSNYIPDSEFLGEEYSAA